MTGALAILGPGVLGRSTARWAAERGLEVRLLGRSLDHALQGLRGVEEHWKAASLRGAMMDRDLEEARARLRAGVFAPESLEGTSVLLEALPEEAGQKAPALAAAASWGGSDLLLLTGTSALPVSVLAEASGIPGRLLGFHLFVPVSRMGVVELAIPQGVPDSLVERARDLGRRLGKRIVEVRDQPGFAAARMALVQGLEAIRLLEAGVASAEDLDALLTLGYGHPVGPLELSDRVGLDLRLRIAEGLHAASGEARFEPPALLRAKVASGETGRKAGRGFFHWDTQGRRK